MRSRAADDRAMPARERILNAAILRFAHHAFAETSLRDIAAEAGVDVAYVHRSFGSKTGLFREALNATLHRRGGTTSSAADPVGWLCDQIVTGRPERPQDVLPLTLGLRSLTNIETREIVHEFIEEHFIKPAAREFGDDDTYRASMVVALLTGLAIFRLGLSVPALLDTPEPRLRASIKAAIRGLLEEGAESDGETSTKSAIRARSDSSGLP